ASKGRQHQERELTRQARTHVRVVSRISFPVNPDVPADSGELDSNKIWAVVIYQGPTRRLECDLSRCLKGKNLRTIGVDCAIVDPRLAARAEFNCFYKCILRRRRGISYRVPEWRRGIRAACISNAIRRGTFVRLFNFQPVAGGGVVGR